MRSIIFCALLCGCAYGVSPSPSSDDGGTSMDAAKTCRTNNAQYEVVFSKLDGDCSQATSIGYLWIYQDGHMDLPAGCIDHGETTACTNFMDEECLTWANRETVSGTVNWEPGKTYGEGDLTFTAMDRYTGALICSSVYHATYTYQWAAAN